MIQSNMPRKNDLRVLSILFGNIKEDLLNQILNIGKIKQYQTGEPLFKQGDHEKSLYIVLSGRFRVIAEMSDDEQELLGDVSEGEPIGEFALFTNEPRSASVYALRPSHALMLSEENYYQIIALQPSFAPHLTAILINRLRRNNLQKHLESKPKNIAVLNLQAENDLSPWTNLIETRFLETGVSFEVFTQETWEATDQNSFFDKLDESNSLKFLVCSEANLVWSNQCLIYADLVIIASDFNGSSELYPIEKQLKLYDQHVLNKKVYLLLAHPENANFPSHTIRWLKPRQIDLHIHFRKNNRDDAARFCRIITNQAIGLVLGGGGAKGYAHFGAIHALRDAGVPIDFLGGTSAGALMGSIMTYSDFNFEQIYSHAEDSVNKKLTSNDYTIPFLSFLSGKKIVHFLKNLFKSHCLEDFWVSTYTISANLTTSALAVHKLGLAWKKILASVSIPGILPPVIIDEELHVDGGVMDNLPIQSMYSYPVGHIIAIALSSKSTHKLGLQDLPKTSSFLWDRVSNRKNYNLPGIGTIIADSMTINSVHRQEQNKSNVSLYVELNLSGTKLLDNSKWELIIQKGKEQMNEFLQTLKPSEKFWE